MPTPPTITATIAAQINFRLRADTVNAPNYRSNGNIGGGLYAYFVINGFLKGEVDIGASLAATIKFGSNISGSVVRFGAISAPVRVFPIVAAATSNVYGRIAVTPRISITSTGVGSTNFGTIASNIIIYSASLKGNVPIKGTISSTIRFSNTIQGTVQPRAPNSIRAGIKISSNILAYTSVRGSVVGNVIITPLLRGGVSSRFGTIQKNITPTINFVGNVAPAGVLNGSIVINCAARGPAVSFDTTVRGSITRPIVIAATLTGYQNANPNGIVAIISAPVNIWTTNAIAYISPIGNIIGKVVVNAYISQSIISLNVGKMNTNVVTYLPDYSISIFKASTNVVLFDQPSAIALSKMTAYAVITPTSSPSDNAGYQAFLFV